MGLYGGFDLHSNNSYLGIKNEEGTVVFGKRLKNNKQLIIDTLEPFRADMKELCVESTYNWYWLADLLEDNDYNIKLANPLAIQQYKGMKNANDKTDAFWLAEMLRLGILPTGHIHKREERSVRDLLRRRMAFVQQRVEHKLSLMSLFERVFGVRVANDKIINENYDIDENDMDPCVKFHIDSLIRAIEGLTSIIVDIEDKVLSMTKDDPAYDNLSTIPGVGKILSMTIILETGDISRFKKVANYTSYCRCTDAKRTSNGKVKGKNLSKCGNKYLSWAFSEAASGCIRSCEEARRFRDRKLKGKDQKVLANRSLATKLCKAAFYIVRDQTPFSVEKCFGYELEK